MSNKRAIVDYRASGAAVLGRFQGRKVEPALKKPLAEFKTQHGAVEKASSKAEQARALRDAVIQEIGVADDGLDAANEVLAQKVVGAGLGTRRQPFATFGGPSVTDLNRQPYAKEVGTVGTICGKITKAGPPADVKQAVQTCLKRAAAVMAALERLTAPQAEYMQAVVARDGLLPAWDRALRRLKRQAAAVWIDDEATYRAIFAPPTAVQRPVARRRKRAPADVATPTTNP